MIDTHSHILPGLDDGAANLEQALSTARQAARDGVRGIVCTPHWIGGVYENTRAVILDAVALLARKLDQGGVDIALYPGAELRVDFAMAARIRQGELLSLNDAGRHALVELPAEIVPPGIEDFFYTLQIAGIIPIIAHPERNPVLAKDPARLYGWIESGALVQLTAKSLLGGYGGSVWKFSRLLLKHGMVHLIATDAHGPRNRGWTLSAAAREAGRIVGKARAERIVHQNPWAIVRGETVVPFDLIPLKRQSFFPLGKFFSPGKRST